MSALALIAASVAKIATEIRHLSRTEVGEVAEAFGKGQKGSSAMPHKKNPIVSEQLTGLARVVGANAATALQNVGLWHERDISHSSVERVILPDSTILVDYMVTRLTELMDGLVVNKEAIRRNLDLSRGLIHSEQVLLALLEAGLSRQAAYETVQRLSFKAVSENKTLQEIVNEDSELKTHLSPEALAACFDLSPHVAHVGTLFGRVFGPPDEQRF
jgi:adenylosuccinate lyase